MSCACQEPIDTADPRRAGDCARCGKHIDQIDLTAFYDRLALTFPSWPKTPLPFDAFRSECEERFEAGKTQFGSGYLRRDNLQEAKEELVDFVNYLAFDLFQNSRQSDEGEDLDLTLEAAHLAYQAHALARRIAGKRAGSP